MQEHHNGLTPGKTVEFGASLTTPFSIRPTGGVISIISVTTIMMMPN